jgi:hypothetical protein
MSLRLAGYLGALLAAMNRVIAKRVQRARMAAAGMLQAKAGSGWQFMVAGTNDMYPCRP